jgi:hypothetical protein
VELFESLQIRNIQQDTLSHVLIETLGENGHWDESYRACSLALSFHAANEKETPDMLVNAFTYSTYSKTGEFLRFYHRVRRSVTRVVARAEQLRWLLLENDVDTLKAIAEDQILQVAALEPHVLCDQRDNRVSTVSYSIDEVQILASALLLIAHTRFKVDSIESSVASCLTAKLESANFCRSSLGRLGLSLSNLARGNAPGTSLAASILILFRGNLLRMA